MIKLLDSLPIGKKTVGFVTLLLAVMLGISVYSFYRIRTVNDEITDQAMWIVPLDDALNSIEMHALAEESHLQRSLRYYGGAPAPKATLEQELSALQARQKAISEEINKVTLLLNRAKTAIQSPEDGAIVGQFKTLLQSFERQHTQFSRLTVKTLDAYRRGDRATAAVLVEQLDEEEDQLDQLATDIRTQVTQLVEERTQAVANDEKAVVWLSLENLAVAMIAFLLGIGISALIARRLVKAVREILTGAEEIAQGNLNVQVSISSKDEIGLLAQSFNHMADELRDKELIKSKFSEYIDPRVVETLLSQNDSSVNDGNRRIMTVFFSDIAGFTTITEMLTPLGLVKLINEYLTLASEPILRHKGVIDKYIGDAIMSFWGTPFVEESEHARFACLAALEQFEQLRKLELRMPELLGIRQGLPTVNVRIGITTGELVVGNIGSQVSKSYTVIGDTVNLAARLESANKQYGTRILLSEETRSRVKEEFETREIDTILVVGKSQAVRIYELMGQKGQVEPHMIELRNCFEQGLSLYRKGDWLLAEKKFLSALQLNASDQPSKVFLERVRQLQMSPPTVEWNGVWQMTTK